MPIEEQLKELDQCYSDALLRLEEYQRRRTELLEQQRIPPSSIHSIPAGDISITEKLQALKRQRENGDITPEEYYEKRGELLKKDQ